MKNVILILIFIVCTGKLVRSQNMDSLKLALKNVKNDTSKCKILDAIIEAEADEKIWPLYNEQLKTLCETKLKNLPKTHAEFKFFLKYYGDAINNIGYLYNDRGDIQKALEYFHKSLEIREQAGDKQGVGIALNNIGSVYDTQGDLPQALEYYHKSLKLSEETGDKKGMAFAFNNIGFIYDNQGDIPKALEYYNKSIKIKEEIGDKQGLATVFGNIGSIYCNQGNISKGLEYYHKSLQIKEEIGDKKGLGIALRNIGLIYDDQGDFPKALEYYNKSLTILEEIGNKQGIATSFNNIARIYSSKKEFTKALDYYLKSLKIFEEVNDKSGMAFSLNNLGFVYDKLGDEQKAFEHFQKSLKIREEIGSKSGMAATLNNIGTIYENRNNISKALECYHKSLDLSREIGYPENIRDAARNLFATYKKAGNSKLALENYELYIQMRDSLQKKENTKAVIQQQFKYEYQKKAAADSVKVAEEKKVVAVKLKQEQTQRYALYGGLALVILFAGFIFNRFRITKKQKNIIEAKEKQTKEQNVIIRQQKHLIEERHKEITDSINYAERIQRSFLATKELLDANLTEYFILFRPKDVVSGDFYWAAALPDNNFALVTADSTGHGVPGAIMSLLNITSLEKAVEHYTQPDEILNATRNTIIERLKKDGSAEGGKDGMDCSLCIFNFVKMKLHVSAAHNPVWIVRGNKLTEIQPDKMPVGKHDKQNIPFTQHEISLQKGDVIYTLTDGFPDQFGGEKGKKFMIRNLRELMVNNAHLPMQEQKAALEKTFGDWAGNMEQVDDVTVIGVKV